MMRRFWTEVLEARWLALMLLVVILAEAALIWTLVWVVTR